jgi:hypothetical protein
MDGSNYYYYQAKLPYGADPSLIESYIDIEGYGSTYPIDASLVYRF